MSGYDFNRPFVDASSLVDFRATDSEVASRYGKSVRATQMSNSEYAQRYTRMAQSNNMKAPPSHNRECVQRCSPCDYGALPYPPWRRRRCSPAWACGSPSRACRPDSQRWGEVSSPHRPQATTPGVSTLRETLDDLANSLRERPDEILLEVGAGGELLVAPLQCGDVAFSRHDNSFRAFRTTQSSQIFHRLSTP